MEKRLEVVDYEIKKRDWEHLNHYFRLLLCLFGIPENGTLVLVDEVDGIKLSKAIEEAIQTLPEAPHQTPKDRPREVVRMRFGLKDARPLTLREIGKHYDLTHERIRQIESKALRMLRHKSRSDALRRFIRVDKKGRLNLAVI